MSTISEDYRTADSPTEESESRSAIERFLEAFLQERNIRWMLGLGAIILLGSSLMFVSEHWQQMTTFWKYVVLLGYTAAIHVGGQAAWHRLGLRKTGTALMAVTLLLIPIVFFALHWVSSGTALQAGARIAFLAVASVFAACASRRIFRHFLRCDRPSVLVAYLGLSLFGAIAPALPMTLAPLWSLLAWGLFAIGSVRANREVFWLTEEHRLPGIFGFFPIALFGLQFLTVFGLNFADAFRSVEWIGFGCVLTAIPVMLTSDAVAKVFQQRTGNLVRPLPWSIVGPIVAGIALALTGVGLAGTGRPPFALVPSATLFAVIMFVTARRTGHTGFVWGMLAGIVTAYQFSPVFFLDLAQAVRQTAAEAVNEQRLPLAYYGLTYMPLLLAFSVVAARLQSRGRQFFAKPLRHASVGGAVVLLLASLSHSGANFLVAAVMAVLFLWQSWAFCDRRVYTLSILAAAVAAVRFVPFVEHVRGLNLPADAGIYSLALTAVLMSIVGRFLDPILEKRRSAPEGWPAWLTTLRGAAIPTTVAALAWWVVVMLPDYLSNPAPLSGLLLLALVTGHTLLSPGRIPGHLAVTFGLTLSAAHAAASDISGECILLAETIAVCGLGWWARRTSHAASRICRAFSPACRDLSKLIVAVPLLSIFGLSIATVLAGASCNWWLVASGLIGVAWVFCMETTSRWRPAVAFCCLFVLAIPATQDVAGLEWVPGVWAVTASAGILWVHRRRQSGSSLVAPIEPLALVALALIGTAAFVFLNWTISIAGAIALGGFVMHAGLSENRSLRGFSLAAANWLVLAMLIRVLCPSAETIFDITTINLVRASLPLAATMAVCSLVFRIPKLKQLSGRDAVVTLAEIVDTQFWLLSVCSVTLLLVSMFHAGPALGAVDVICAVVAFVSLATSTFLTAAQQRSTGYVWVTEAVVGLAVAYLWMFDVIGLAHVTTMYAVLVTAIAIWLAAKAIGKRPDRAFVAGPMQSTARLLPLLTVAIAFTRWLTSPEHTWPGWNSLAVLLVAAGYFLIGIEEKRRRFVVLSAAILNLALMLLWNDLRLTDPQFFMIPIGISVIGLVELMKRDLPESTRNPLRYAGALIILVSPTFHIVSGSWLHLISLMVCSTLIALVAIGLKIRPLLYTGTAFLIADVIAMVVRGSIDQPDLLWLAGLTAGAGVIATAAYFERHRENVLSQMRMLASELKGWE